MALEPQIGGRSETMNELLIAGTPVTLGDLVLLVQQQQDQISDLEEQLADLGRQVAALGSNGRAG
jgi:hypothetical protein